MTDLDIKCPACGSKFRSEIHHDIPFDCSTTAKPLTIKDPDYYICGRCKVEYSNDGQIIEKQTMTDLDKFTELYESVGIEFEVDKNKSSKFIVTGFGYGRGVNINTYLRQINFNLDGFFLSEEYYEL